MYHFCTLFDKNYLLRGLTLYRSLLKHDNDFQFYILCLDTESHTILSRLFLPNVRLIQLEDIEQWEIRLKEAKSNRSRVEYFFTLSPALPLFILNNYEGVDVITYLDADLFFYHSPKPIYDELGDKSILVIEHRFPARLEELASVGRFNVQYQSFRNDEQGKACLARWLNQCLAWCYDRIEENKFADQKYLDEWPNLYDRLTILQHKGAGLAPWNWSQYTINLSGNNAFIDNEPLVFYHFHGVKIINQCFISHAYYKQAMPHKYLKWFYRGYIQQLKETLRWIRNQGITTISLVNKQIRYLPQSEDSKLQKTWNKWKTQGVKGFYNSFKHLWLKLINVC